MNRFDPSAYKSTFYFTSNLYPMEKLSKVAFINPKTTFDKLEVNSEISFIPMEAVNEYSGAVSAIYSKKVSETKGFTRFVENDLIWAKITPCMQNGKSAVARNLRQGFGCGSTEFFVIRPKSGDLLVDYLHFLLRDKRILETAQNFFGGSAGQQRVAIGFLENFPVPIPTMDIQQQIVAQMQAAYAEKRQKEAQAAQLLASIDGYLLEKLGITLPQAVEKKKTFVVWSDKVSGGRFDPKLYLPSSKNLLDCLCTSKYESTLLKNIVNQSVSGDWGIEDAKEGYSKCLVIRATEFDNRYNLKLENSRVKYRYILNEKLSKLDVQANDLLIEKSGGSTDQPVGRIALITNDILNENAIGFSNFVHKIRLSSAVHPEFVYYFLKLIHNIKVTDLMQSQTNGIRNLIMREYLNIPIPIPPMNIQTEIVTHISTLRTQAQQLETEAKTALTSAKAAVEKSILG